MIGFILYCAHNIAITLIMYTLEVPSALLTTTDVYHYTEKLFYCL